MILISARIRPWLGVATWLAISSVFAADPEPAKIEAREPRAQIRTEILKETQIGSSPDDVLKFISKSFKPKKEMPAPKLRNHPAVGPTAKDSDKKGGPKYSHRPGPLLREARLCSCCRFR